MATRRRGAAGALLLTAVLAGAGAGCTPGAPPSPGASSPGMSAALPAGVHVELRQSRSDVAVGQAAVRVVNESDAELRIGAVSVSDPRFDEPAERIVDRTSTLAPGVAIAVRVQLSQVRCDAPADATAAVKLHYEIDGVAAVAEVPIVDVVPFVAALHTRECVRQRSLQTAAIDLDGFTPAPAARPAALSLSIVPRGQGERLRVVGISETNLLTFAGADDRGVYRLDIEVPEARAEPVTMTLPLLPARCDPHAVLEDKRGTVFRLHVETGGAAGTFDLAASEGLRGRLLDWVAQWCGFGID